MGNANGRARTLGGALHFHVFARTGVDALNSLQALRFERRDALGTRLEVIGDTI